MRRGIQVLVLVVAAVLGGLCAAGCGRDTSPTNPSRAQPPPTTPTAPVKSVAVNRTPGLGDLAAGGTSLYTAVATLENGQMSICTSTAAWASTNPAVAAAWAGGQVTGISPGTAVISATCSAVMGSTGVTVFEGAVLFGTVVDDSGRPVVEAGVYVRTDSKGGTFGRTDETGAYWVAGIVRGRSYSVTASKAGYEYSSTTVTLSAPETRVDFTLPVGVKVSGIVLEPGVGPIVGASVQITSGSNAGKSTITETNGFYSLAHLKPERFILRASKPGYDPVEQTVDAVADAYLDVRLQASHGSCLAAVTPSTIDRVPSAGTDVSLVVEGHPGRAWAAASDQPWVQFPQGPGGSGRASLLIRVLPNPIGAIDSRSAVLRVGCSATEGENVRLTQLPDCRVTLSWAPGSATSFPALGGVGHVVLHTGVLGCHWQAFSQADWLIPVGVNDWYGDFDPHFTVRANSAPLPRSGVIVYGETAWEVRQEGAR